FFFSSRRRHTRWPRDWSSDVCSSDLGGRMGVRTQMGAKAVPFGFVLPSVPLGDSGLGDGREHRLHFQGQRQLQGSFPQVSISCGPLAYLLPYERPIKRPVNSTSRPHPSLGKLAQAGFPVFWNRFGSISGAPVI